ncbi:MAG: YfcE family phosphodiesterase [Candidatus Odinarchaeum yellowstonii]|uniref:Phosphoesterase n=1 Tax=Odinarchaeota yellowstonii (strain LCB_4) TaxID=1841599 RepID=A0AAF0IBA5_ODILC|nr:MAG: YfcE family phosphodiesterase [Candidatus Odinarchaeum yellowstonii]
MAILILGDLHIPGRAKEINPIIREHLERRKSDYEVILCTGDLTSTTALEYITTLGVVKAVRGNMDHLELPEYIVENIHGVEIGLIHGDQVYPRGDPNLLSKIARGLKVRILVSGHTHSSFSLECNQIILLNPGSITGAWGGGDYSGIPEFMELQFNSDKSLTVILNKLLQDKIVSSSCNFKII